MKAPKYRRLGRMKAYLIIFIQLRGLLIEAEYPEVIIGFEQIRELLREVLVEYG
jgi:hypothetical protein